MDRSADELVQLFRRCVVQVLIGGRLAGSGFFGAPGLVISCAHVVDDPDQELQIRATTRTWDARVVAAWRRPPGDDPAGGGADPQMPDDVDLCVIRLEPEAGDGPPMWRHPVVWLDDRPQPILDGTVVTVGSFAKFWDAPSSTGATLRIGGWRGSLVTLDGPGITDGMSGSPVLDPATGAVCAVVKATHGSDTSVRGGLAVPVQALRAIMDGRDHRRLRAAHDRYHHGNHAWIRLADGCARQARQLDLATECDLRVALVGVSPDAPQPEPLGGVAQRELYRRVVGRLPEPDEEMVDDGDLIGRLQRLPDPPDGEPPYLVRYAEARCECESDEVVRERLTAWRARTSRRLCLDLARPNLPDNRAADGPGDLDPPQPQPPSVMVCVRPAGAGGRKYVCTVLSYVDSETIVAVVERTDPMSLPQLRAWLKALLPGAARRADRCDEPPLIEWIVPEELADEKLDEWPSRTGRRDTAVMGKRYPVVVRSQERFDEPTANSQWRRHWAALEHVDLAVALHPVACTSQPTFGALNDMMLRSDEPISALLLPCSPRHQPAKVAFEAGLDADLPVMVWRHVGCTGGHAATATDCRGHRLRTALLARPPAGRRAGRDELPERIRTFRVSAADPCAVEYGCGDVVVLWDDPCRRIERLELAEPGERRSDGVG